MAKTKEAGPLLIERLSMEEGTFTLVGTTGLYCHRMAAKAKRQLMLGGRKKTAAERLHIKHDPRGEFLDSMHVLEGFHEHSNVMFPAMAIKSAMATAALVVEGVRKTDVQRLVFFPHEFVPIFGIPRIRMDITRSADINKTPDVRTRAYFREWATVVTLRYAKPQLSAKAVSALLFNAGMMCGIGDFRQEKGKGSYGTFEPTNSALPETMLDHDAQWAAIQNPDPDNPDTVDLLLEFDDEVRNRS